MIYKLPQWGSYVVSSSINNGGRLANLQYSLLAELDISHDFLIITSPKQTNVRGILYSHTIYYKGIVLHHSLLAVVSPAFISTGRVEVSSARWYIAL